MSPRRLPLLAAALLLAPAFARDPYQAYFSRKLAPKERPVSKVLVLPAYVQLTKSGVKGKLGMTGEADPLAARVTAVVSQSLQKRQLEILPNPFTEEALEREEELRDTLARLQARYDALSVQLHARPKDVRQSRYSLGDEVAALRPAAGADAIVFIRGSGTALTRGKAYLGMMGPGGGGMEHSMQTILSFADARSGVVLAYVEILAVGDYVNQTEKWMAKPLAKMLKKIPFTPR